MSLIKLSKYIKVNNQATYKYSMFFGFPVQTSPPDSPMGHLLEQMYVGPSIPEGVMGMYNGTWAYTSITRTLQYFLDANFAQVCIYCKRLFYSNFVIS